MKFIDLNKQYNKLKKNLNKDILSSLEKGDYILGQKVFELEDKLAKYVGVKHCVTCASGTDALLISLMSNNVGKGDVVFTTNFSFFATAEVISLVGAKPNFVDIDKTNFNIDPDLLDLEIQKSIKKKMNPKAIIAVDLFGHLADYKKIEDIAKKYNLVLIQDAAQSFGASFNGRKSCSFGDIAATSFYPAKPLGCYGDGGAIFTNNTYLANICKSIRVHGQGKDKYDNIRIGLNSRLDTLQAVILLNKIKIFDNEIKLRNKVAQYYSNNLSNWLNIPKIRPQHQSSWAQYSVVCNSSKERSELIKYLMDQGIPTSVFYKNLFSDSNLFGVKKLNKYPVSKHISKTIFSLPMHPYLEQNELDKVIISVKTFLNH